MRFWLAVAVVVASIGVSGLAQQNGKLKVKHTTTEKAPKSSVAVAMPVASTKGSGANAKDLQSLERQTAKSSAASQSAGKKTPGAAPALKPVKDKPNPPINFGGTGGGKKAGMTNQSANPYKGRLKQKRASQ
jgi:hypothetical protein